MATLNEKLLKIQTELKAPKNLVNKFGGYNYRNVEGILEAVKPLLKKHDVTLSISDEVVEVASRVYVKATATLSGVTEVPESISVTAYAREAESKKGMDEAQITGASSSYARKYALNGLFLLDDNKDADTEEYYEATKPAPKKAPPKAAPAPEAPATFICERCGNPIANHGKATASQIAASSKKQFGLQMCYECAHAEKETREGGLPFPMPE